MISLNSNCFPMVGLAINLIVGGLYTHHEDIKGGMTITI